MYCLWADYMIKRLMLPLVFKAICYLWTVFLLTFAIISVCIVAYQDDLSEVAEGLLTLMIPTSFIDLYKVIFATTNSDFEIDLIAVSASLFELTSILRFLSPKSCRARLPLHAGFLNFTSESPI